MPYYCYILSNKNKTVIYVGATSSIKRRMFQHKTKFYPKSFTAKYNCYELMYYETFTTWKEALARETQLKAGNRKRKEKLIESKNAGWIDLAGSFASLGEVPSLHSEAFYIEEIW